MDQRTRHYPLVWFSARKLLVPEAVPEAVAGIRCSTMEPMEGSCSENEPRLDQDQWVHVHS